MSCRNRPAPAWLAPGTRSKEAPRSEDTDHICTAGVRQLAFLRRHGSDAGRPWDRLWARQAIYRPAEALGVGLEEFGVTWEPTS